MPRVRERRRSPLGWTLLGALCAGYCYSLWAKPVWVGAFTLLAVGIAVVEHAQVKRRLTRLAATRSGESLCTFARVLALRSKDTWVIRAVYEQLQDHLKTEYPSFPLRPTDRLNEDLGLDPDDLDLDLASEIAERTGRSLLGAERNPYYAKVTTVGDLVAFFCAQAGRAGGRPSTAADARAS